MVKKVHLRKIGLPPHPSGVPETNPFPWCVMYEVCFGFVLEFPTSYYVCCRFTYILPIPSVPPRCGFCCCGRRLEPSRHLPCLLRSPQKYFSVFLLNACHVVFTLSVCAFSRSSSFTGGFSGGEISSCKAPLIEKTAIFSFFLCIGRRRPVRRASRVGALAVLYIALLTAVKPASNQPYPAPLVRVRCCFRLFAANK